MFIFLARTLEDRRSELKDSRHRPNLNCLLFFTLIQFESINIVPYIPIARQRLGKQVPTVNTPQQ
jgi:hypothetical protein